MAESMTVVEKALQKLSDQLTCAICLDTYQNPKVLPCLHVYCETCLEKLVSRDGSRIVCPSCRRSTMQPDGGVSIFESAFYIHHLADIENTLKKVKDTALVCQHCEEHQASSYCRECSEFYCNRCSDVHKQWRGFRNHRLTTVVEVQAEALNFKSAKQVTVMCTKHPIRPAEIYCETCEELICQHCVVKTHRDHEYDLAGDCYDKHRDAITASLYPVKQQLDIVNHAVEEMNGRQRRLAEHSKLLKSRIQKRINQLHLALETRKDELLADVDRLASETGLSISQRRESYEMKQAELSSCLEYVEGSIRTGAPEEVLSIKTQVLETVEVIINEFNPDDFDLGPEYTISHDLQHRGLAEACLEFGKVYMTSPKQEANGSTPLKPLQPAYSQDDITTPSTPISFTFPQRRVSIQNVEVREFATVKEPRGLTIMQTGELVVVDRSAKCTRILDPNGTKLRSIGKKHLSDPHDVTVCSDNSILVVDKNCIKKFNIRGKLLTTVGTKGDGRLQFEQPLALTWSSANRRVYVCDTFNNRIQILNSDLSYDSVFGVQGSGPGEFNAPTGIAVDKNGNVFVADYHNNRIQVFSPTGEYLREIKQLPPSGDCLQGPVCVFVDVNDSLYVLESNAYRVSVFNNNNECIRSFTKRDKEGEFNDLHGIAVDSRECVYVSDTDNHKIHIFQQSSQYQ